MLAALMPNEPLVTTARTRGLAYEPLIEQVCRRRRWILNFGRSMSSCSSDMAPRMRISGCELAAKASEIVLRSSGRIGSYQGKDETPVGG